MKSVRLMATATIPSSRFAQRVWTQIQSGLGKHERGNISRRWYKSIVPTPRRPGCRRSRGTIRSQDTVCLHHLCASAECLPAVWAADTKLGLDRNRHQCVRVGARIQQGTTCSMISCTQMPRLSFLWPRCPEMHIGGQVQLSAGLFAKPQRFQIPAGESARLSMRLDFLDQIRDFPNSLADGGDVDAARSIQVDAWCPSNPSVR